MLKQIQMSLRMLRHQTKREMLTLLTRKERSLNSLDLMTVLEGCLLLGGVAGGVWKYVLLLSASDLIILFWITV